METLVCLKIELAAFLLQIRLLFNCYYYYLKLCACFKVLCWDAQCRIPVGGVWELGFRGVQLHFSISILASRLHSVRKMAPLQLWDSMASSQHLESTSEVPSVADKVSHA